MSVDAATVRKIARLARIRLEEAEVAPLAAELTHLLGWVAQLDKVDTSKVAPLASIVAAKLPWRKDVVTEGNQVEAVLANAPERVEGYFAVPKVVE